MNKIKYIFILIFSLSFSSGFAGDYYQSKSIVQDKNFYFLTALQQNDQINEIISENQTLSEILIKRLDRMNSISDKLRVPIDTVCSIYKITDEENQIIINEFTKIINDTGNESAAFKDLINHLRNTKKYILFNDKNDDEFIKAVWNQTRKGLNFIIDVYGLGFDGKYAKIDSVSYYYKSRLYQVSVHDLSILMNKQKKRYDLFFEPVLKFALELMYFNNRDEAARFEPMEKGENRAAHERIKFIDWEDYSYSVMLVPGYGPEEDVKLHPLAIMRTKIAADRYKKGLAPLIILSGGYVHPFQTKYCEAYEMKQELMNMHNIPESSIIIEPHARHTTTNFRNAARLIYKYGIPNEKKALVTTTKDQSYYITDMNLDERCRKELGYVPYELYDRLNLNDVEFKPVIKSLHIDSNDPLDP